MTSNFPIQIRIQNPESGNHSILSPTGCRRPGAGPTRSGWTPRCVLSQRWKPPGRRRERNTSASMSCRSSTTTWSASSVLLVNHPERLWDIALDRGYRRGSGSCCARSMRASRAEMISPGWKCWRSTSANPSWPRSTPRCSTSTTNRWMSARNKRLALQTWLS